MRQASDFTKDVDQLTALNMAYVAMRALVSIVDASDEEHRRIYAPELAMAKARLAVLDAYDVQPPQVSLK